MKGYGAILTLMLLILAGVLAGTGRQIDSTLYQIANSQQGGEIHTGAR